MTPKGFPSQFAMGSPCFLKAGNIPTKIIMTKGSKLWEIKLLTNQTKQHPSIVEVEPGVANIAEVESKDDACDGSDDEESSMHFPHCDDTSGNSQESCLILPLVMIRPLTMKT